MYVIVADCALEGHSSLLEVRFPVEIHRGYVDNVF
jgi:hypothetical protein